MEEVELLVVEELELLVVVWEIVGRARSVNDKLRFVVEILCTKVMK